jgi:hypothetical protein
MKVSFSDGRLVGYEVLFSESSAWHFFTSKGLGLLPETRNTRLGRFFKYVQSHGYIIWFQKENGKTIDGVWKN